MSNAELSALIGRKITAASIDGDNLHLAFEFGASARFFIKNQAEGGLVERKTITVGDVFSAATIGLSFIAILPMTVFHVARLCGLPTDVSVPMTAFALATGVVCGLVSASLFISHRSRR